jgi:penicillin-binding protein 2
VGPHAAGPLLLSTVVRTVSPTSADQAESTRLRLTFLTLLVVSLFVLLFARLWFLQVMAGETYAAQAEGNAVRTVVVEAPRGNVLDRAGETIVRNRYAPVVSVQPDEMGDRADEVFARLSELLDMPVEDLRERAASLRVGPFRPRPVAIDVPEHVIAYIHENGSALFPGVYAETLPLRDYPHGTLAAHVVGYIGEISEAELDSERYADYRPGELIGWAGIERTQEAVLRGQHGRRQLEVDPVGRVLRDLGDTPPVQGADVVLTLDLDAQRLAEDALAEGIEVARTVRDHQDGPGRGGTFKAPAGAAVVLDPRSGEVLALASHPTFDPSLFVGGISQDDWNVLQDPDNDFPLINRAIQSSYPPGSVYKIVPAGAALEEGYLSQDGLLPCPGRWQWNEQVFHNWRRSDSGAMNLIRALEESCDTVFYELARRMWNDEQREREASDGEVRERLADHSRGWGLGAPSGIDLPSERGGVVPGREWKRTYWEATKDVACLQARQAEPDSYLAEVLTDICEDGHRWRGGDAVNMSIGQGDVQTSPLQIANAFAAVANRGTLYRTHVTREIHHRDGTVEVVEPEVLGEVPVSRAHLDYIHRGLVGVTQGRGTAASVFGDFPVQTAGKTGTAEFKPKQPIAWYTAYAPADDPQYVVVAMVEEGGGGSQTAAPIVRRILEGLLGLDETDIDPGAATE